MSNFFRSISRAALVLVSSAMLTVACDDDEEGEDEHSTEEPAVCKEISMACHDLDTPDGPEMAHTCHEEAHAGDAAHCEEIKDDCLAFCMGAGTGDSGGSSSSG